MQIVLSPVSQPTVAGSGGVPPPHPPPKSQVVNGQVSAQPPVCG